MAVRGVDRCPGGWVAARVAGGTVEWHAGRFADLLQLAAAAVGVDVPVGLSGDGRRRAADVEARALLGPQRSSVFFAPPRMALEAASQSEATRLSREAGSTGVSVQVFHPLTKIADVDDLLRRDRTAAAPVVEVHPELSLRALSAAVTLARKRTLPG